MEIRHLRAFLSVAKLMSFNKAADRLNYAQSSISSQIRALETELGVRLFDRLGRRIMLTEAGDRLIPYATKIVDLAEETHGEISGLGQLEGSLTIRIPETLGVYRLPPVIAEFTNRYPRVRLHFTTCSHEGLQKDLRQGTTDLAFLLAESVHSADMDVEALGFEPIVLVAPANHRLANEANVCTRDLRGETILLSRVDCSYRPLFEKILEEENIVLDSTLVFHSVETLKRCVMAGAGITALPLVSVIGEIQQGTLSKLAWREGEFEVAVLMIWSRERWLSSSLTAFMDITRKHLTGEAS